jgi:hypothetical protein
VDETIAQYEKTLEDIKNGLKVSKYVDGSDDVMLSGYDSSGKLTGVEVTEP